MNERLGSEPEHSGNVTFRYCESRIDYMGSCILMGNISAFHISVTDEWKTNIMTSLSTGQAYLHVHPNQAVLPLLHFPFCLRYALPY